MTTQERKTLYLELLSQVDARIPQDFADKVKMANPTLKIATIQNVRYGRSTKLDVLIFIIRICVPGFMIPQKFIDATSNLQAA